MDARWPMFQAMQFIGKKRRRASSSLLPCKAPKFAAGKAQLGDQWVWHMMASKGAKVGERVAQTC